MIKRCVVAPDGYVLIGLDADSLEDKISALTTKDPNKLAVYEKGLDGHCFNTFHYFREQMPDIEDTIESINSIADKYPVLRQDSKSPTFLMTYLGGIRAMMRQFGFTYEKAESMYNRYHQAYSVSIKFIADKIDIAREDGYVTCAFGLRLRTPLLHSTRYASKSTLPYAARKEEKTASNALGQSWCMLTSRNANDMDRRIKRDKMEHNVKLCMLIHDALYYYVKKDLKVIKYVNDNLVDCFEWQDHPEIYHDMVKLSGTMSIFYPTWNEEIKIPKRSNILEISEAIKEGMNKYKS